MPTKVPSKPLTSLAFRTPNWAIEIIKLGNFMITDSRQLQRMPLPTQQKNQGGNMVDTGISPVLNHAMNGPTQPRPRPEFPDIKATPLAYAKGIHALEKWLSEESKAADEAAYRYGKNHGMNETEIGAAIGRTAQHVYKVAKRLPVGTQASEGDN